MPVQRIGPKQERRKFQVNIVEALEIARKMLQAGASGKPKPTVEMALLFAYCNVADGVAAYPASTRFARALLVCEKATVKMCDTIDEVAAMPDSAFIQAQEKTATTH